MSAAEAESNITEVEQLIKQYKTQAMNAKTLDEYIGKLQAAQKLVEENNLNEPEFTDNLQAGLMMNVHDKRDTFGEFCGIGFCVHSNGC